MPDIRFRPHHFLCTLGFEGKGYSESFVKNYAEIARELRETVDGDKRMIEVVDGTDSICGPCPNRREDACETEAKIRTLDGAHAKILGVKAGDRLTWGSAKKALRENMSLEKFTTACAPCAWQKAGMCEKALTALREMPMMIPAILSILVSLLALTPVSSLADPVSEYETRRSAIREKIVGKTKAPKAAKALEKASRFLEEEKYAEAISSAASAEGSAEFADHALAIKGSATVALAEVEIELENLELDPPKKTDWKKVEADSTRSVSAWGKILDRHFYSPWWARASKEIGRAELSSALAKANLKRSEAAKLFEKAFQRLTVENGNYLIRPVHLDTYADLCLKNKTELCSAWIVKFSNTYSKNSAESKRLAKKFAEIVAVANPTFANSKVTTGYKQKDADEDTFDKTFPMIPEEKWADAVEGFKNFLGEYPRSAHRFRARYWLAYALEKKKSDEAKGQYEQLIRETPLTVYGLLSMIALKQDPEGRFKGESPALVDHDDLQTPVEAARLARAKKLLAAKADRLAAIDLRSIRSRDTASGPYLLWLSSFAAAAGSHLTAFSLLSDMIARMDEAVYTSDGLDLVFPIVEWPVIEAQASAIGVDPILVLSLIKQESAFEREASSSVGASGYMQLMPFTASDVEPDVERRELLDPETNIRIGTKYLKKGIERFKGNVALALSGYNAGPTAANRWIREGRASRSFMEYVEQIPYKETRDYVGSIYRNYVWYKYRIRGERVTTTDAFWPQPVASSTAAP